MTQFTDSLGIRGRTSWQAPDIKRCGTASAKKSWILCRIGLDMMVLGYGGNCLFRAIRFYGAFDFVWGLGVCRVGCEYVPSRFRR